MRSLAQIVNAKGESSCREADGLSRVPYRFDRWLAAEQVVSAGTGSLGGSGGGLSVTA